MQLLTDHRVKAQHAQFLHVDVIEFYRSTEQRMLDSADFIRFRG
jgi:hypothetical protein